MTPQLKALHVKSIGRKFGRLTPLKVSKVKRYALDCVCECGRAVSIYAYSLIHGHTKSCGCFRREHSKVSHTTHGETANRKNTREYNSWCDMKRRCSDNKRKDWEFYGGRGIRVCDRWMNFKYFLSDMGRCPDGYSLDRIDNSGNYSPENCRWADKITQMNNTRGNRFIEFNGRRMTVAEWERKTGLPINTRIGKHKWDIARALTQPHRYAKHARPTA